MKQQTNEPTNGERADLWNERQRKKDARIDVWNERRKAKEERQRIKGQKKLERLKLTDKKLLREIEKSKQILDFVMLTFFISVIAGIIVCIVYDPSQYYSLMDNVTDIAKTVVAFYLTKAAIENIHKNPNVKQKSDKADEGPEEE